MNCTVECSPVQGSKPSQADKMNIFTSRMFPFMAGKSKEMRRRTPGGGGGGGGLCQVNPTFGRGPVQGREAIRILSIAVAVGQSEELAHEGNDPRLGCEVQSGEALVLALPPAVQDASHHADVALCRCKLSRAIAISILHGKITISQVESLNSRRSSTRLSAQRPGCCHYDAAWPNHHVLSLGHQAPGCGHKGWLS